MVMANNLDLRAELLGPTIAQQSITEEQARFEALFFANASLNKTDTPTATTLSGSQTESSGSDFGVDMPLRTGGNLRVDLPSNRFKTDNQFSTLNPAYTADFAVSPHCSEPVTDCQNPCGRVRSSSSTSPPRVQISTSTDCGRFHGLDAAASAAAARRAADIDDDVTDVAGVAGAAVVGRAVEHQPAADTGGDHHAE